MKIKEILKSKETTLSFEVFPPKAVSTFSNVKKAALDVASLSPDYMSITYGASGSIKDNTVDMAAEIQRVTGVTTIAHLTCIGADRQMMHEALDNIKRNNIENILALRGDMPKVLDCEPFIDYRYASDLVRDIKSYGDFCVGGACYPEGHIEATNKRTDIDNLKLKVDAGCDYLTTQMFFDNNIFYKFLYRVREHGIFVPIIPGIMPITRASQVKRAIELSGTNMPERFRNLVDHFGCNPAAMQQAGIAYATDQIIDLIANGISNIHVYSMNSPHVASSIQKNLSEILR